MRVLLVSHSYLAGGAARYVRELHNALPRVGVQTRTLVVEADPPLPPDVERLRLGLEPWLRPLELLPGLSDWRHRASIRRLDAIRPGDFDLVHLNLISGGWCSLAAVARLCRRVPVVWTHHDEWAAHNMACRLEGRTPRQQALLHLGGLNRLLRLSPYHDSFKSRSLGRLLDRVAIRPAVHVCPSEHMARIIRAAPRFAGHRVEVIPNATTLAEHPDAQLDPRQARERWSIPLDARVVLMACANIDDYHKGMDLACAALREVHRQQPIHLLLLGRGAEHWRSRLSPVPLTAGYAADDAALASAYRAADVTLIPSRAESYSYVAVESLACGRPYVGFNVGGVAELSHHGAHAQLAPAFDAHRLAERLLHLLRDESLRYTLGEAGSMWVQRNAAFPVALQQVRLLYEDAAGN